MIFSDKGPKATNMSHSYKP